MAGSAITRETVMSITDSYASIRALAMGLAIASLAVNVAGCGTNAGQGAAQAETKMREGTTALGNIREQHGRSRVCAT